VNAIPYIDLDTFMSKLREPMTMRISKGVPLLNVSSLGTRVTSEKSDVAMHALRILDGSWKGLRIQDLFWLTDAERGIASRFASETRAVEYCIGRMLAKRAAVNVLSQTGQSAELQSLSILDTENGVPKAHFESQANSTPNVSISLTHKNMVLAAVASKFRVGIDLEDASKYHPFLAKRIVSSQEVSLVESMTDEICHCNTNSKKEAVTTCLWSLKEAAFKALHDFSLTSPLSIRIEKKGRRFLGRPTGVGCKVSVNVGFICIYPFVLSLAVYNPQNS
jgi:phosphopantetheinyl transferase (holo-ACP synthase)